jgi:hypothetical protein
VPAQERYDVVVNDDEVYNHTQTAVNLTDTLGLYAALFLAPHMFTSFRQR